MARRGRGSKELAGFAEDLGRLLGTAQSRAAKWIGERQMIAKQLQQIRDTSSQLLGELATAAVRGRRAAIGAAVVVRRRRNLSAKARKAISDAQKRRWAAVRAAKAGAAKKK